MKRTKIIKERISRPVWLEAFMLHYMSLHETMKSRKARHKTHVHMSKYFIKIKGS